MNDNIFFDTNILIYCYTETEPIKQAIADNPNAWISTQVLQEFSNTLRKKFGKTWTEIEASFEELTQNFEVFTNQSETIRFAFKLAHQYKFSFYDCIILSSALACNCTIIYSEDMQNGAIIEGKLKIINPF